MYYGHILAPHTNRKIKDSMFDSSHTQRVVREMQSQKVNEDIDILKLGTEVDIKNPLIQWNLDRSHRLVQRERRAGMIQTT